MAKVKLKSPSKTLPHLGVKEMLRASDVCFTDPRHRALARELLAEESDWVTGPVCDTPTVLLRVYGFIDATGKLTKYGRDQVPQLYDKDSDPQMVAKILKYSKSWGEFLGGVIASFPQWESWDRLMVRADMEGALRYQAANGPDH